MSREIPGVLVGLRGEAMHRFCIFGCAHTFYSVSPFVLQERTHPLLLLKNRVLHYLSTGRDIAHLITQDAKFKRFFQI